MERAAALLAEAEAFLARRECGKALTTYDWAAYAGADEDRCAGGRWMAYVLLGEYEQAWGASDAIRERGAPDAHRFWNGESIDGKRVMVRCLHGYGDTVMYLRWLPELWLRCSEVVVQACPEMLPLVAAMVRGSRIHLSFAKVGHASLIDDDPVSEYTDEGHTTNWLSRVEDRPLCPVRVVSWATPGESDQSQWDVQVECAELPYLFRVTTATLPAPVQLRFAEEAMHRVQMRLGERTKPRVGLVWIGSSYDPGRSIPFAQISRLLEGDDAEFWSLHVPEGNDEWDQYCVGHGWGTRTFYSRDEAGEAQHAGIADMAVFASGMDLVITIDTMAAHVAGSLGLPTWLLLKHDADWRWMMEREDSPWYATMRLFRQTSSGDWSGPLARVCDALRNFGEERRSAWD